MNFNDRNVQAGPKVNNINVRSCAADQIRNFIGKG